MSISAPAAHSVLACKTIVDTAMPHVIRASRSSMNFRNCSHRPCGRFARLLVDQQRRRYRNQSHPRIHSRPPFRPANPPLRSPAVARSALLRVSSTILRLVFFLTSSSFVYILFKTPSESETGTGFRAGQPYRVRRSRKPSTYQRKLRPSTPLTLRSAMPSAIAPSRPCR